MHKSIISCLALLTAICVLIGCDSSRKQIVGKWKAESSDTVWEFSDNGSVSADGAPGRYSFGDNKRLKIETSAATFVYTYEFAGERMIWKDPKGSTTELVRIK